MIRNSPTIKTLDITGGAPELNAYFRYMVEQGCALGVEIIDRCATRGRLHIRSMPELFLGFPVFALKSPPLDPF